MKTYSAIIRRPFIGQAAFTLIEIMVSAAIIFLLLFALLSGTYYGFDVIRQGRENQRATQVLAEKMEQMRLFNWDQITTNSLPTSFTEPFYTDTNGNGVGFYYTGAVAIAAAPLTETYATNMRLVTISLQWVSANVPHQRDASTFVARDGLYNYVY
jgi:type II secretory pathway pseudopilin PulG